MSKEYQNFDLIIERVRNIGSNQYRVRVDAPTGKCTVDFTIPFSLGDLEKFVSHITLWDIKIVKRFGARLFKALFTDEVLSVFSTSLYRAKNTSHSDGLRIRLLLTGVPELADIPWEYLYNPASDRFLSLSTDTPIVRYLDLSEINPPSKVKLPLRILVMTSNPYDYPMLNVEQEWENLQKSLNPLQEKGLVEVVRIEQATVEGLLQYLRKNECHVFHFIGHGTFDPNSEDGFLIFENEKKEAYPVSGEHLGVILHDEKLRMAVLNACQGGRGSQSNCFAGVGQSLIRQGVSAVIAMQFSISDKAALTFSREFYKALTDGDLVDAALAEARKAIFAQKKNIEWGTPVLYTSVSNQRIFDIDSPDSATSLPSDEDQSLQEKIIAYLNETREKIQHNAKDEKENNSEEYNIEHIKQGLPLTLNVASRDSEFVGLFQETEHQDLGHAFYNRGKKQFVDGNWTAAAATLHHIPEQDKNYQGARQLITTIEAQRPRKRKKPSTPSIIERQHVLVLMVMLFLLLLVVGLMNLPFPIESISSGKTINSILSALSTESIEASPLLAVTETIETIETIETESEPVEVNFTPTPLAEDFPIAGPPPDAKSTSIVPVASEPTNIQVIKTPTNNNTALLPLATEPIATIHKPIATAGTENVSVITETPHVSSTAVATATIAASFTPTTSIEDEDNQSGRPFTPTLITTVILPTHTATLVVTASPTDVPPITVTASPTDVPPITVTSSPTDIPPITVTPSPTRTVINVPTETPIILNESTKKPSNPNPGTDDTNSTNHDFDLTHNEGVSLTPEPTE